MNLKEKSVVFVATGCFSGNIPFAPGTFGTIAGLPVCFLLSKINLLISAACAVIFIFFAIWVTHLAENILNEKDPGCIVIDEMAGFIITLYGLPFNMFFIASGFIVFRLLDIIKPFPIKVLEKKLSGGVGIVLDDVAAGVCANIILRAVAFMTASSGTYG